MEPQTDDWRDADIALARSRTRLANSIGGILGIAGFLLLVMAPALVVLAYRAAFG